VEPWIKNEKSAGSKTTHTHKYSFSNVLMTIHIYFFDLLRYKQKIQEKCTKNQNKMASLSKKSVFSVTSWTSIFSKKKI